eukprot:6329170-Pyramimonas_sp.AAC.1
MREAYQAAQTKVTNVIIPPVGSSDGMAGQGAKLGSQTARLFTDRGPWRTYAAASSTWRGRSTTER